MDLDSQEKMARFSRKMMVDFLKKGFARAVENPADNELVKCSKLRFRNILKHVYEGEILYFLNPLTGGDMKPDEMLISSDSIDSVLQALDDARSRLYQCLSETKIGPNERFPNSEMTPNLVWFWLVEHDAWHHGQLELLLEIIEKGSLQPEIVFEES